MSISKQLREVILSCGKTAYLISQECGVPQPTISRFLNGAEMKSNTIDKLATYFNLELRPVDSAAAKLAKPAKRKIKR